MNEIEILTRYSHEYTEDALRCKLHESLKDILSTSQERTKHPTNNVNTIHFNDTLIRVNLLKIDWKCICSQYNSFHIATPSSSACVSRVKICPATTLDLLLDVFENPTIWPNACLKSTFRVLVEVVCMTGPVHEEKSNVANESDDQSFCRNTSELSPSQNRIFGHLTLLLQRNPWMHNISFWTAENKSWLLNGITTSYRGEIALRMLRSWFVKFPDCKLVWIALVSNVTAALDAVEASIMRNLRKSEVIAVAESSNVTRQQRNQYNDTTSDICCRKRAPMPAFDYQSLHDEGQQVEISVGQLPASRAVHQLSSCHLRGIHGTWMQSSSSVAHDMLKLWKVKASSLEFLATCSRRIVSGWTFQKHIPFQSDPLVAILHELLDTLCAHPNSSTTKLCCILVAKAGVAADSSDSIIDGLDTLLSLVWWRATDAKPLNDVQVFAHFYSELLIICSRYDNQDRLMKAMTPLLAELNQNVEVQYQHRPPRSVVKYAHPRYIDNVHIYRKCFAHIVSCRGNIMLSPSPSRAFPKSMEAVEKARAILASLVTKASLLFDQPSDWIDPSLSSAAQFRLLKGLQLVGILGLDASVCTIRNLKQTSPKVALQWISDGSPTCVLENVTRSIFPWLSHDWKAIVTNAFSNFTKTTNSSILPVRNNTVRLVDSKLTQVSCGRDAAIMDVLQEDLILNVFSFLSYKRLVRMRLVCMSWKLLADRESLWLVIYNKRYKHASGDKKNWQTDPTIGWRKLFIDRHQGERAIRNRKSIKHPGWRIRLCNHFNCLVVLRTPESFRKHNERHKAKAMKGRIH